MIKETMISTVGLPAGGYAIRPKTGFGQMKYRTEHDSVGDKNVPEDAYYGVQTLRAVENFRITGLQMHPEIISSLGCIRRSSAALPISKKPRRSQTARSNFWIRRSPERS